MEAVRAHADYDTAVKIGNILLKTKEGDRINRRHVYVAHSSLMDVIFRSLRVRGNNNSDEINTDLVKYLVVL